MAKKHPELTQSKVIEELPLACADEAAAVAFIEAKRWGGSPCCVHCGSVSVYQMTDAKTGQRSKRFLWRCRDCKKQYTARVGTIFSDSPIPMHKWCRAFWEAAKCKNGVSARELQREVQVSYRTALFMLHRIRFAMAPDPQPDPMLSGPVEMDETYVGGKPRFPFPNRKGWKNPNRAKSRKSVVVAIVQRGGDVRARVVPSVTSENLRKVLRENVQQGAVVHTDELKNYRTVVRVQDTHRTVNHSIGEYVDRSDPTNHTNTIEGFFSRVKRSLNGTYHAVSKEHLHRYVAQAAFLYNTRGMNDGERVVRLIQRADGKRLTYVEAKAS